LEKRRTNQTATTDLTTLEPMLRAIALMPPEMQKGATEALKEAMRRNQTRQRLDH
jgi:hypothetical protein